MWPFRRKPLLEPEMADWMLDHAEWLLGSHRAAGAFARAQLLPISESCFPTQGRQGHDLAEHLLDQVLGHMHMSHLRLRLVEDEISGRFHNESGNIYAPQPLSNAAGTYCAATGEISYDPTLLKRPPDLVAVLAHEVAHAVVDLGASRPAPSDEDFDELLTDFASVFLGFGLFQIAFRKPSNPRTPEIARAWAKLYTYYMNRREGCFATALFAVVHGIAPPLVLRAADLDCRGYLKRAFADLEAHRSRIGEIRQALLRAKAL